MQLTTKDIALTALFAALTAVGALISFPLPFSPVPITLQSLFTYLSGLLLGARLGTISQAIYVALRVTGLFPAPAGAAVGPLALVGPTGGYLFGFIVGAFVIGLVSRTLRSHSFPHALIASVAGTVVIYALGLTQLAYILNLRPGITSGNAIITAITVGAIPFLLGDAAKIVVAAYISTRRQVVRIVTSHTSRGKESPTTSKP